MVQVFARKWRMILLGVLALSFLLHVASPFVASSRMWRAAQQGDSETLSAVIDWERLRSGIKQDIADGIVGMRAQELVASNSLPPFGSSFMTALAGSIVDRDLTPAHLAVALRGLRTDADLMAQARIVAARFTSPISFELALHVPGQEPDDPPLRLHMEWRNFGWQIVRATVPQDLMEQANFED